MMKAIKTLIPLTLIFVGLCNSAEAQTKSEDSTTENRVVFSDPAPQFVGSKSETSEKIVFQDPAPQIIETNRGKQGQAKRIVFTNPAPQFLNKDDGK